MAAYRQLLPELLKAKGHDLKSASKAIGRNPAFLHQYVTYNKPQRLSEEDRERLAGILGVPPDDLRENGRKGVSARRLPAPVAEDGLCSGVLDVGGAEFVSVGRYDAALSAGPGSLIEAGVEPLGYALFERQWLQAVTRAAPEHLAIVRVDGDSMESTLHDGDWVLVDRAQTRLNREGIYAVRVGDVAWVKRITLNLREKLIRLISDNPAYPVQELAEDELAPIGRVVWIVGRRV